MDPLKENDVEEALKQQQHGAVMGTAFFASLGVLNQVFPGFVDYYGARSALEFFSATHRRPTGYIPKIQPAALAYLLPSPIGVVPPEVYGFSPDYLQSSSGVIPQSEYIATEASPERKRVFETAQRLGSLIEEEREVLTFAQNFTGGTGRLLIGKIRISREHLAETNVEGLESDLAFLKALPKDLPPQLSGIAKLHTRLTDEKVEGLIEELQDVIAARRAFDAPAPAGGRLLQPGEPVPPGGGVLNIGGRDYFYPAPNFNNFGFPLPDLIPPEPRAPLPLDTPPANVLVRFAAATANDVVRNIEGERGDP